MFLSQHAKLYNGFKSFLCHRFQDIISFQLTNIRFAYCTCLFKHRFHFLKCYSVCKREVTQIYFRKVVHVSHINKKGNSLVNLKNLKMKLPEIAYKFKFFEVWNVKNKFKKNIASGYSYRTIRIYKINSIGIYKDVLIFDNIIMIKIH